MPNFRLPPFKRRASGFFPRVSPKIAALVLLSILLVGGLATAATIVTPGKQGDGTIVVPSNQVLKTAGTSTLLSQRPVDIALRPDGKQLAVTTTNLTFLIEAASGKVTQSFDKGNRNVAGLAYSPDGTHLYYSKGETHQVALVAIDASGNASVEDEVDTGKNSWPAGLSVSPDGKTLYVALFGTNSLGIIDIAGKKLSKSVPVGSSPFGSYVSPDGKKVYTSNWGGPKPADGDKVDPVFPVKINPVTGAAADGSVSVYDVAGGQAQPDIKVGLHPTAITFDKSSSRLFVANSNEDTISVIDITANGANKEMERIGVKPSANLPFGSLPNGLALSADGATLYVANGGNNAIAVVSLAAGSRPTAAQTGSQTTKSSLSGFIPTEWFPIGVVLNPANNQMYIANNKGEGSINNLPAYDSKSVFNLTGSVSIVPVPDQATLATYTSQVDANSKYTAALADSVQASRSDAAPVPVPARVGEPSVFKHVIYIIKENRTYDQVFGDMGKGNGMPSLTQFPRQVSPNHHALADRFGLFDNFYACSVNSADGHQWTDQAIANVFAERVYGFYPSNNPKGITSYGNSSLDLVPDSLWSNALAHKVSLRNYGEDGNNTVKQNGNVVTKLDWSAIYNDWKTKGGQFTITTDAITPPLFATEDHSYPGFETAITDQIRMDEWQKEFNDFVKNNNLPQLQVVWLPDDHTSGVRTGSPTPEAQVADNDLALGRLMDSLSRSPYWKDTAVFVVEDDAQDGVDHVDGHRTVGMVMSAYNKPGQVNSTLYNQTSMVRTIEQILGLPPMNQFDLTASLMSDAFTTTPDLTPYTFLPNQVPLDQLTGQPQSTTGQAKDDILASNKLDFSKPDLSNPAVLNPIIWRATMGNQPYPNFAWLQNSSNTSNIAKDPEDETKTEVKTTPITVDTVKKDEEDDKN